MCHFLRHNRTRPFNSHITIIFFPKNVYIRMNNQMKYTKSNLSFVCTGSSSTLCLEKSNSLKDCFWHTKQVFFTVDHNIWAPTWNSFICMHWDTWSNYSLIYIFQIFQMGCTAPIWSLSCSHSWISERILFFSFGLLSTQNNAELMKWHQELQIQKDFFSPANK